jgi:DNA-binding MarR family transcriptional regulator
VVKRSASASVDARSAAQLREEVAHGVRRAIALTVLYNDQVASKVGMSASESQSMHLLQLYGPMTPGRLAEVTGLSTGTITGVVDRLERLGFARRERSTQDRRKVLVVLDEEVLAEKMAAYYAEHATNLDTALRRYSREELVVLADFVDRLAPMDQAPVALPDVHD